MRRNFGISEKERQRKKRRHRQQAEDRAAREQEQREARHRHQDKGYATSPHREISAPAPIAAAPNVEPAVQTQEAPSKRSILQAIFGFWK